MDVYASLLVLAVVIIHMTNAAEDVDNRTVMIPGLIFGLHLPILVILVTFYFLVLKPCYRKSNQRRLQRANATSASVAYDPNRPCTPQLTRSISGRAVDDGLPMYWSDDTEPIRIVNITKDADFIKTLVYNLWSPKDVGVGRDTKDVGWHRHIKITKVQRVENVALFHLYNERRQKMLRKEEKVKYFRDLGQLSSSPVETTDLIQKVRYLHRSVLETDMNHDINEHYLFHGTLPQNVKSICNTGMSTYYVSRALFGEGIYTAENPTKSDQYTNDNDGVQSNKGKKLLLVRVCLGELYIHTKGHANYLKSPPCRSCYNHNCKQHKFTFDSAVGDLPNLRFREFVVYRDYRIYPEYIISYDRVTEDDERRRYLLD